MEHLRAMDHLRSSIGLQGYAQVDPKVEYKREGMKIFSEMWTGVSDKVTDLVFRVEQLRPRFPLLPRRALAVRPGADDPSGGPVGAGGRRRAESANPAVPGSGYRGEPEHRREEAGTGAEPWQKSRPQRPLPLRFR